MSDADFHQSAIPAFPFADESIQEQQFFVNLSEVDSGSGKRYNVIRKGKTYIGGAL